MLEYLRLTIRLTAALFYFLADRGVIAPMMELAKRQATNGN